jgi:hypothetical protein
MPDDGLSPFPSPAVKAKKAIATAPSLIFTIAAYWQLWRSPRLWTSTAPVVSSMILISEA